MELRLFPLRFFMEARERIAFPEGRPENVLRGAFGMEFRRIACVPECEGVSTCEQRERCAYARMFEPGAVFGEPSGFANWPRPFVFRARGLDGRVVRAGEGFEFDVHLFEMKSPAAAYLALAFARMGRAAVREVRMVRESGEAGEVLGDGSAPMVLGLEGAARVERVVVRFVTPTELKSGQRVVERPEFGVLAGRIRDRVSKLRELYDAGALEMDFQGFGERAAGVRLERWEARRVEAVRRSGRTGQVHSLGGFVGEAEYVGELGEFVPWLKAARWTGVGRQTVWGKGELEVMKVQ